MQRITPGLSRPLHTVAGTRSIESAMVDSLPPHTLMQRAGLAVARLALAIAPHAQRYWIACGPGNNGGDGLEAARHLKQWGKTPLVTWLGTPTRAPVDARSSYERALAAGVQFLDAPPAACDCVVDALLGIGTARAPEGLLADWIAHMNALPAPVIAVDLPSGLDADRGTTPGACVRAHHTLALLTLKPGLFTAHGRDYAGDIWLDDLGADLAQAPAQARLGGAPIEPARPHASHKGNYGDVAVIGGARGMTGAALLAARAALHHGAGRVYLALLDGTQSSVDPIQPELMFRSPDQLNADALTVVAGCGGGTSIATHLPRLLSTAARLVLDADGLNAIAIDTQLQALLRARAARGRATVLTPHPLEAARLLGCSTSDIQHNRLQAAQELAARFNACIVLKGSGTVIAAPEHIPVINPTGNARLATAGTGDVLAGWTGARLAQTANAFEAAQAAVWLHGHAADEFTQGVLTASDLGAKLNSPRPCCQYPDTPIA